MANTELKLHYYQKALVKKLTLSKSGKRFNELLIKGLESEHMNYHLKQLVVIGFVEKLEESYLLTDSGKDYSNLLDDGLAVTEKQPKTSIIVHGVRKNKKGQIVHLLNRRLRQPYHGKVGHITGKVLFGETLAEAAARELYEETGLTAKNFTLEKVYRKMRKREDDPPAGEAGMFVQDVIFYVFFVTEFSGRLIGKTPFQENFWATKEEIFDGKMKYSLYDDFSLDDRLKPKKLEVKENIGIAEGF
jgi:8-oxo-dGTP pyrophosphatase MutT (NUDIX family)